TDIERAFQINVHHRAETIRRELIRGHQEIAGGAIDDDIYSAKVLDGSGDRSFDLLRLTHVRRHRQRLAAIFIDCRSRGQEMVHLPADQRYPRATLSERARYATSDSGPATGHKRHAIFQNISRKKVVAHRSEVSFSGTSLF